MRKVILLALLIVFAISQANAQVTVTFLANTAGVPDTLGPGSVVQVRGSVAPLTWGGDSPVFLHNIGGDYWMGTAQFTPGDTVEYKFYTNAHDTVYAGAEWEHKGWEGDLTGGIGTNRALIVGNADTTLPLQFVNGFKAGMNQYDSRIVPQGDSIDVWFRVNMHPWEQLQKFDPATQSVGVRGSNTTDWTATGDLDWGNTLFLTQEGQHVNSGSQQYDGSHFWSGRVRIPTE